MRLIFFVFGFLMLQTSVFAQEILVQDNIACSGNVCFPSIERCEEYVDSTYDHGERAQRCSERPTRMYCYIAYDNSRRIEFYVCYSTMNVCNSAQTRQRHRNFMSRYSDFTECSLMREQTAREIEERNRLVEQELERQRLLQEEENRRLAAAREANSQWCFDFIAYNSARNAESRCFDTVILCNTERQRVISQNNLNATTVCQPVEREIESNLSTPDTGTSR